MRVKSPNRTTDAGLHPDAAGAGDGPGVAPDDGVDVERTVRLARRRFARRQWTRRFLAWRRVLVALLAVGLVALVVWLFYFSSVLAVSGVTVTGSTGPDAQTVRRAAQVPLGGPLATADLGAIQARVQSLPIVRSADVSRSWPDHVRIEVTPRVAVAVLARGGGFRAVDDAGVQFRTYRHRPAGLPVLHMGTGAKTDTLAQSAKVAGSLPPSLAAKVGYVDAGSVDTITLHLKDGRTVLWGSAEASADKAEVVAVLLKHKASFYDVSVPGQPVLRR